MVGLGLVLLASSVTNPRTPVPVPPADTSAAWWGRRRRARRDLLDAAGLNGVPAYRITIAAAATALVVLVVAAGITRTLTIAAAFAAMAWLLPWTLVRRRAARRRESLREVWPDVVDNVASSVRAGLALPEALAQLATSGPEPLREPFARFAADYRSGGRFGESLDDLKARLADPVADRLVEALRVAREVGGHDLGVLLRTLSAFLREDLRTRGELRSRQSWTINGARLAVAAPWVLLGLLALRPEAVAAYDSGSGAIVLAVGAAVCFAAYRVMLRIGRLPEEQRVLR
jgi:tight adherence protein B